LHYTIIYQLAFSLAFGFGPLFFRPPTSDLCNLSSALRPLATREKWLPCSSFFSVDLRPDGEHHIPKQKRIQRDEGDVAAEVEGEDHTDEEEEHAARLVPLQVLPR
jgi:hypothetical protein